MTMPRARLDSWKAIAQYLGRDVTTVRRWEKRENLPVHRHLHDKLGSIYAYSDEIDAWSASRSQSAAPPEAKPASSPQAKPTEFVAAPPAPSVPAPAAIVARRKPFPRRPPRWLGLAAAVAIGLLIWSAATTWAPTARTSDAVRVAVATSEMTIESLVISPGGKDAVVAAAGPDAALWIRRLDSPDAKRLPGTEGAADPFWSPDGTQVGFFAGGRLKRLALATREVWDLAAAPDGRGGTWNDRGDIVFAPGPERGLLKISANGGPITTVTTPSVRMRETHAWPSFLPDGRHVLYTIVGGTRFGIHVLDLGDGFTRRVLPVYSNAIYANGYLLYGDVALMARPFDVTSLETSGDPIEVAEKISQEYGRAHHAEFSASRTGLVVARRRPTDDKRLVWVDRSGRSLARAAETAWYSNPVLTPDGRTILTTISEPSGRDTIWQFDAATLQGTRWTSDGKVAFAPVVSTSGDRLIYATQDGLVRRNLPGPSAPEPILKARMMQFPDSWSRDGRHLTVQTIRPETKFDIWAWDLQAGSQPFPVVQTAANEGQSRISPDGRFLAYTSDESGRFEVYVREFPYGTEAWQVSAAGGADPHWGTEGRELFFVGADRRMNAVRTDTRGAFRAGTPWALFPTGLEDLWQDTRNHYDVTPDGQRFVIIVPELDRRTLPYTAVVNWAPDRRR